MEPIIGELERRDIRDNVRKVLRDLGNPPPPLSLPDVRQLLELDLRYYDGSDDGLFAELAHRARLVTKKTLPDLGRRLRDAVEKAKLLAFWVPETKRVLIDSSVPKPKHRWIEGHEIIHSVTPWHRDFLLGDDGHTLDPTCHAMLEAEANFGAAQLLFLQDRFRIESRDVPISFEAISALGRRYANTITSTLWRFVEDREPERAVFGMISIHPHHPEIGAHDGADPWRYFIRSAAFRTQFSNIEPDAVYRLVSQHASRKSRGPVALAEDVLRDVNGLEWEFRIESFSNTHALLTIGDVLKRRPAIVVVTR